MSDKYYVLTAGEWNHNDESERARLKILVLDRVEREVRETNPIGLIIPMMTEINIDWLYGEAIERLHPWCVENNKFIHLLAPALPNYYDIGKYPYLKWHKVDGYDIQNFYTIQAYYKERRSILMYPHMLFTCYNNKPHVHRDYIVDQFAKHWLFRDGVVTWHGDIPNGRYSRKFEHYKGDPILRDESGFKLHETNSPNDVPQRYLTGFIDIVTETNFEDNEFFMSEKTSRPLMTQKPFLVLGPRGYHKWLETKGIQKYDELFDYGFDDEPDMEARANGIIENLLRLRHRYCNYETDERQTVTYRTLLNKLKPKLKSNLNAYINYTVTGKFITNYNNPFPWLFEKDVSNYVELQRKESGDEFDMLHNFCANVVSEYHNNNYELFDVTQPPERYYLVEFQHSNKFPELWKDHPIRSLDVLPPTHYRYGTINCAHMPHEENELRQISAIATDIEKVNPDRVLIFSGSEMDFDLIYGELYYMLGDWCKTQNKKIHIFVSNVPPNTFPPEWVEVHKFVQTYDVANIVNAQNWHKNNLVKPMPTKLFSCYNGRTADYRLYLVDQLAKYDLLEISRTVYRQAMNPDLIHPDSWMYYNGTPILIDEETYPECDPKYHGFPRKYMDGCIDIVTETRFEENCHYMSEKTARAVTTLKPFLVLSSPGYHTWLEHKGIEKYDEIFDYSFDDEKDFRDRAKGIVRNLVRLSKEYKTPEDYARLLEMLKPKLKRNLINYVDHVYSGRSILPFLPDWLTYSKFVEMKGGDIRGNNPINTTHHHGTLGLTLEAEHQPIIYLLAEQENLRTSLNGDWRKMINDGWSFYEHILNL